MKQFRYLMNDDVLLIDGEQVGAMDSQSWFAPLELVGAGSLASFRRVAAPLAENYGLRLDARDMRGWPVDIATLRVTRAASDDFDDEYSIAEPVAIGVLADGRSVLGIEVPLHGSGLDEDDLAVFLSPLLERCGARYLDADVEGSGTQAYALIRVEYGPRGATIEDATNVGMSVFALLEQVRDRDLVPDSAKTLVLTGRADLLIGLEESSWLEAKSQGYDLSDDRGRIELAQDVARFANGDSDGLLVIGVKTSRKAGREVITKVTPALDRFDTSRYHRAIDAKLFPPIAALEVRRAETPMPGSRTGHLLIIHIPRQPEEMKPFLVHGAIVQGRVEGAFISIVQRRGEHSVPVSAATIHSTLAAGRALLRRGLVSPPVAVRTRRKPRRK